MTACFHPDKLHGRASARPRLARRLLHRQWPAFLALRGELRRDLRRARARGDLRARIERGTTALGCCVRLGTGDCLMPASFAQARCWRRERCRMRRIEKPHYPLLHRFDAAHERAGQYTLLSAKARPSFRRPRRSG